MIVTTATTVKPEVSIDTESNFVTFAESTAHDEWIAHCEGATLDETALRVTQSIMESFVTEHRTAATSLTYGLVRGLLRKTRKPEGTPANLEGASQ